MRLITLGSRWGKSNFPVEKSELKLVCFVLRLLVKDRAGPRAPPAAGQLASARAGDLSVCAWGEKERVPKAEATVLHNLSSDRVQHPFHHTLLAVPASPRRKRERLQM